MIFGIGLPKTGTMSLALALGRLGFTVEHNPKQRWADLYMGLYTWPDLPDAAVHFGTRHYRRLEKSYPGSTYILTVRNKRDWLDSCEAQFRKEYVYDPMQELIRVDIFGTTDFDRDQFSDIYDAHFHLAMRFFDELPANRWLVMDVNEGWGPLCEFLEKDEPDEPFPHANQKNAPAQQSTGGNLQAGAEVEGITGGSPSATGTPFILPVRQRRSISP